jgi:septal ring factor EnvC (AmiA/AmiB activator)
MRLKSNNDSLEGHIVILRVHCDASISNLYKLASTEVQSRDAEIIKLKEQYCALTKEKSDHVEHASAESQSKDALISELQKSLDDLTEEKGTMDANYGASMLSQDASIVRLESEKSTLAWEIIVLKDEAGVAERAKVAIAAAVEKKIGDLFLHRTARTRLRHSLLPSRA